METREEVLEDLREFEFEGNSSQGHSHIVSTLILRTERKKAETFTVHDVVFEEPKPSMH